jgi:Low-density lipoprotein receptor repeat class B
VIRTSKASSAGSNSGRGVGRGSLHRAGVLLVFALLAAACLVPGSALAAETRPQIGSFGPDGTSSSQFEAPGAIAVDQGTHDVYVADYGLGKVEKFDQNGAPTNFSALGSNEIGGFLLFPGEALEEIAVNSTSHDFYVADYGNGVIKAFQQNGQPAEFTAGPGAGSNELPDLVELCGVAVDANGLIYMGDYGAGVHIFKPDGEELTSFAVSEPCNVAVDANGVVYVAHYFGGVDKFTPSEFPVTTATAYPSGGEVVDPQTTSALSVDPSSNDLYVDHANHVAVYGSSGALRYEFGGGLEFSEGIAVDGSTETAYASDGGSRMVQIFGPPIPLPDVITEDADAVTTTLATLHATVNPKGKQLTGCHFDFVPASQFSTDEYESVTPAEEAPCVPAAASIPPDSTGHAVKADISGLNANTTYHFRLVAATAEGTSNGADRTLTTAIGEPTISSQSVETVGNTDATVSAKINPKGAKTTYHVEYGTTASYGQSSVESAPIGFASDDSEHSVSVHIGGLSVGTAYHFRFVATSIVGKAEGTDTSFATYPATPLLGSCPNDRFRTGFGARLSDCRAYEQASPVDKHDANVTGRPGILQASSSGDRVTFYLFGGLPTTGGSSRFAAFLASRGPAGWSTDGLLPLLEPGYEAHIAGWSDDLGKTLVTGGVGTGDELFLRDSDTAAYQAVLADPQRLHVRDTVFAADTSHLIFEADAALLPGAAAGKTNLYDLDHGALTLPGRIPVGPATSCDDSGGPACVPAPEGAFIAFGNAAHHDAISRDGSKVFFTARTASQFGAGQIYLREDATKTTQISASQKTNGSGPGGSDPLGPKPAKFVEATPDGSHAFFTSPEELTNDANTGPGPALGRANLDGSGINQSFVPLPEAASGVAVDGSHIYWANPSANTIGRANLDGTGANQSFISGASKPQYVAVDGAHVYWTNAATGVNGAGTIGRANLDGTSADQSFIVGASNPQGIAVDGSFVYWANAGTTEATRAIGRANLDGTSPSQSFVAVTRGTSGPSGIAVNASFIYWANSGPNFIGRANLDGTSPNQSFIERVIQPRGLALDGSHLYWANNTTFITPSIGRAKLDGSEVNGNLITTNDALGLAVDGAHLYWGGADARDTGSDLYRYDSASGDLTDLSVDSDTGPKGADVTGFLGASDDGSYVYFVANAILAPGAPPGRCVFNGGSTTCTIDLYLSHAGATTFVAQLGFGEGSGNGGDTADWSLYEKNSRLASDGTLVFSSGGSVDLSGHDHSGACVGGGCLEFYRYTPTDEELNCVTCITTDTPAREDIGFGSGGVGLWAGPRFVILDIPESSILSRNLSADGDRLFFSTPDALLPTDTNGVRDVYEWEAKGSGSCETESQDGGCIYLISSGTSPDPSWFGDASANGDHVFFFTSQQLVPGDHDELVDVYDAGVGGGLASQHTLAPPTCAGAACQVNPAPPPDQPASSAVFSGPGNAHKPPAARKCPKGKRQVRRAGKVRCQRAHKQHKRHSNRGGSK